ncbi:MAG: hypothetical protein OEZ18_05765 [Candidatus Bathyarchaeota archaeon]|nr:hypothetical protein [Candidatus Bathyarchaeota archaeon]
MGSSTQYMLPRIDEQIMSYHRGEFKTKAKTDEGKPNFLELHETVFP